MKTKFTTIFALTAALVLTVVAAPASAAISPQVTVKKSVTVSKRNHAVGASLHLFTGAGVDYLPAAPYSSVDMKLSNTKVSSKALRCAAAQPAPDATADCPDNTIVGTFSFQLRVRDANGLWKQCPDPSKFTLNYETKLANFAGNDVGQIAPSGIAPQDTVHFSRSQGVSVSVDFSSLYVVSALGLNPAFSASVPCDPLLNAGAQLIPWVSDFEFKFNGFAKSKHPFLVAKNPHKKVKLTVATATAGG